MHDILSDPEACGAGRWCNVGSAESSQQRIHEARRLWEGAAEQGHAMARIIWVSCTIMARADVNYKKAVEWYKKAAEQGYAKAQYNLGVMYDNGRGVDVNYKKAAEWYEKAAEQGLAEAQYNLGMLHYHGHGVDVNTRRRSSGTRRQRSRDTQRLSIIWVSCTRWPWPGCELQEGVRVVQEGGEAGRCRCSV